MVQKSRLNTGFLFSLLIFSLSLAVIVIVTGLILLGVIVVMGWWWGGFVAV